MAKNRTVKTLVTLVLLAAPNLALAQDIVEMMNTSGRLILAMYDDQETMGKNVCTDAIANGDLGRSQAKIDTAAGAMAEMKQLDASKDMAKIQDLTKTIKTLSDEEHRMLSKYDLTSRCSD